jgi:tetratricopeptide (TPR) repeat protein
VYQQAAALDPTGTEVLYKAAVTAVALRRMHRAAHLFERVLQLNPGNYTAAVNLKLARAAAKSMKPSADYLQESIEKARRYLQSGRYALAEQLLTSVAEHHTAAAVFQLRAEARLALRRPRLALSDGGRSLALNPGMIDALRVMGDGHRQLGHAKKARYYYQLYLTRSSSDPTAAATRSAIEKAMQELR